MYIVKIYNHKKTLYVRIPHYVVNALGLKGKTELEFTTKRISIDKMELRYIVNLKKQK